MMHKFEESKILHPPRACPYVPIHRGRVFFNRAMTQFIQVEGPKQWRLHRCACGAWAARYCSGCGKEQPPTRLRKFPRPRRK